MTVAVQNSLPLVVGTNETCTPIQKGEDDANTVPDKHFSGVAAAVGHALVEEVLVGAVHGDLVGEVHGVLGVADNNNARVHDGHGAVDDDDKPREHDGSLVVHMDADEAPRVEEDKS